MKHLLFAFLLLCITSVTFAQLIKDPIVWKYATIKKTSNIYDVVITAILPAPWHIYSQNTDPKGPVPTHISFNPNPLFTFDGPIKELGHIEKVYDNNFGTNVLFYTGSVRYVQAITLKSLVSTNITGTIEYMVCNDKLCLPPKHINFNIEIH